MTTNRAGAEVVLVGTELVLGDVSDLNGRYIVQTLMGHGIRTSRISIVGDREWAIEEAVNSALKSTETDLIVVAGGLGPTSDDVTSKAAARLTGSRLVISNEVLDHIRSIMAARGKEMRPSQERQALLPQKAKIIPNVIGTACGYKMHHKGKLLLFLPGVPKEMREMFNESLLQELAEELPPATKSVRRSFHTFGLSESAIEDAIAAPLKAMEGLSVSYLPSLTEVTVKISAEGREGEAVIDDATEAIREALGDFIFGEDGVTLEESLGNLLSLRQKTLSIAESCTGGGIARRITAVPGSSGYFPMGIVAYSNEAKLKLLGVQPSLIEAHGAVSPQVATAMAQGMKKMGRTDYGLAITGIAGPAGGSEAKPVGTVFIALSSQAGDQCKGFRFSGSREDIRETSAQAALELLRRKILSS